MIRNLLFSLLVVIAANPAFANNAAKMLDVTVLPGWRLSNGNHMAALELKLKDGWKTYWRAPGDAGIPPRFIWNKSRNLEKIEINWPTPKQFSQGGLTSIGYDKTLVLPITVTPTRRGQAVRLVGSMEIGVCKDICVPMVLKVSQVLPAGVTRPDHKIVAALAEQPYSASEAGVGRVVCHVSPRQDGLTLRAEIDLPSVGRQEAALVETDNPEIWVANAKTTRRGGRLIAETELYHAQGGAFALNRSGLRITVIGTGHAVDIQGCPAG